MAGLYLCLPIHFVKCIIFTENRYLEPGFFVLKMGIVTLTVYTYIFVFVKSL